MMDRYNTIDRNKREVERIQSENARRRKNTNKNINDTHDANNPDYGIGTHERSWHNHKWVDRKKGKNGKWIYDYGYGYGKGDPSEAKRNNARIHQLNEESRRAHRKNQEAIENDIKRHPLGNPSKAAKLYLRDASSKARSIKTNTSMKASRILKRLKERLQHDGLEEINMIELYENTDYKIYDAIKNGKSWIDDRV